MQPTISQTSKQFSNQRLYKKTYHLTQEIVDAVALYSAFEKEDKSEVVRKALTKYIPEKYFQMAKLNE